MDTLLRHLASLSPEPFDCIVHVGAGADADSADYAALNPKHVVLIEADPEAHAALAERFKTDSHVTVIQALVAPQPGETAFRRFSLQSFNAPLGLGRLREIYPRIGLVEELRINSQDLHQILPEGVLGERNLLIFDIPGQEAAVLRTLDDEFLKRFSGMLVVSCEESWQEGAEPLAGTMELLKEKNYELVREAGDDPAWPCVLLMHDAAKAAMQQELDQRARLLVAKATQIHQQTEKITALTAERDALLLRVSTLEAEHSDLTTRHQQLATEREALQSDHSSISSLHSSLIAERDGLATALEELQARHSSLVAERDRLATTLEEHRGQHSSLISERDGLAARLTALESDHSGLVTRHSSLVTESKALRSDLSAKSTLLDVLTKGRIAQDEQMDRLLQEQKSLVLERDALASRVSDLISQVEKLEAHAKLIDEEFGKAEGQIELIKDIFLREAIR